jgi:methylmalonyl-CoA/ethylmalonyl-CoA epimerase
MTEAADIARWIHDLAGSDPKQKAESAIRLYLAGVNLCMPLLSQWVGDPEFRGLTLPEKPSAAGSAPTHHGPSTIVVGIAVHPETFEKIRAANNSPRLAQVPPDQDAQEFELHLEDSIELDILTTYAPGGSGAIARFLEKFGEGIQQVEIYVRDVDRATAILRSRFGLAPIYPTTRPGADGTRVNFFLGTTPDGKKVLIELVEAAD